jgi:hypothetical protein
MKKATVLFLVLVFAISTALAADGYNFLWSESEQEASEIDGEFHSFETAGLKIWIPAVLEEQNLSDEELQAGYIGIFATQSHSVIKVTCIDESVKSLEEYSAELSDHPEITGLASMTVNGMPALNYEVKDMDNTVVSLFVGDGRILELDFSPVTDNMGFISAAMLIIASIQPI